MFKKIISVALVAFALSAEVLADEGMWLPALISQRIGDMQAKGFKLTAEDIYSVNQASLKDAVVLFGSGCTGELISGEGLLVTNHHCGYSQIQKHSSVEHDYLRDGFWAMTRSEELPNPGLTVKFLERMEDVTDLIVNKGYTAEQLVNDAVGGVNGRKAQVESIFYGNQYYLFVFREYRDVRLVGAPPSSIGKFGGDTDNWMWPRHTGDFSMFRIYADKDNNPADYSADNVPYTPRKYFRISRAGVKEGDFTFIYGCPGSTREYIHSEGVRYISEVSDPAKVGLRTLRLDIMKKYMDSSQQVRIQYSSKAASVSNAWKKWQGEAMGIDKNMVVDRKRGYEQRFREWAKGTEYDGVVDSLGALYAELEPYNLMKEYYQETAYTVEIASFANRYLKADSVQRNAVRESFYKDYYQPIDKECFIAMMGAFDRQAKGSLRPEYLDRQLAEYGSIEAWAEAVFGDSLNIAYEFYSEFMNWYREDVLPQITRINGEIESLYKVYMRGQMAFEPERTFYPDANLTLRVAYGKVQGYEPSDGVYYYPNSTLRGVMEKDNPEIFDYNIPQVLRDIYAQGGYEDTPVCFLATNHTTGGNSGSPVINADGDLIGINFDRVWEGTMSDIAFDPRICRNISLDIRYLLFVVEKVGGASHLLEEMTFAN